MSYIGKVKIGANGTAIPVGSTLYGTASWDSTNTRYNATEGNLSATYFDTLINGVTVYIQFTDSNTHANPTLKVGGTNAKPMHRVLGTAVGTTQEQSWGAGAIVGFTYVEAAASNTGAWVMSSSTDANTTYTFAEGTNNGAFTVTESSAYATAAQGTLATNAMPKSGGEFTGNVSFASGKTLTVNTPSADSHAATKKYVDDAIGDVLGAADAVVFKGTLGEGGTITTVPNGKSNNSSAPVDQTYQAGWTYKIITAGTYAGKPCEAGDLLIAIHDSVSGQTAINNDHWTVAQGNLDGTVNTVNGGTSGSLAKFTNTHTIENGPAFTTSYNSSTAVTTSHRFLREDGSWVTPKYTTNTDVSVTQSPYTTSTNGEFPLLFKKTNNTDAETGNVNFAKVTNTTLTYNPSTGTLSATKFAGDGTGLTALSATVIKTALDYVSTTANTTLSFLHKSGAWKTISLKYTDNNTTGKVVTGVSHSGGSLPTLTGGTLAEASVSSGVLTLVNQVHRTFSQGSFPTVSVSKADIAIQASNDT